MSCHWTIHFLPSKFTIKSAFLKAEFNLFKPPNSYSFTIHLEKDLLFSKFSLIKFDVLVVSLIIDLYCLEY